MSLQWKCDRCDTYNVGSDSECFVCGQRRSAESIRLGKRRAAEERISRISAALSKTVYRASKIAFIAGLTVSLIVVAVLLITRISAGQTDDIRRCAAAAAEHAGVNLRFSFERLPPILLERVLSGPPGEVAGSARALLAAVTADSSASLVKVPGLLSELAKKNAVSCYMNRIVPIAQRASSNAAVLGAVLTGLISGAEESVYSLYVTVCSLVDGAVEHIR